mgnify:CR=1 FL=1
MDTPKIFDSELRFCEILWQHEPVKSSELVRLCAKGNRELIAKQKEIVGDILR